MRFISVLICLCFLIDQNIFVFSTQAKIKNVEQDESLLEYADFRALKQTKFNKTTMVFSGKMIIHKTYPHAKISVGVAKKMGNGYIPTAMGSLKDQDYCEVINNPDWQKQFFEDVFNHTNLPNNCNHIPGEYTFNNYVPAIPEKISIPPGEYRGEIEYTMDGKPILKYKMYVVVW